MTRLALLAFLALAGCRDEGRTLGQMLLPESGPSPEEARGRALVQAHGCGTCHIIPGVEGANGLTGPPLTAMAHQAYVAGVVPNTPDYLVRFIMDPRAIDPRSAMPDLGIGAEDAAAIAAFLYAVGDG